MIAYVKGDFTYKSPAVVHVDVNGLGYEVQISLHTFSHIQPLTHGQLYTYQHIREDAHVLYGFFEVAEKEMFVQLISISGVGAATARMMLSSMKYDEIARAIVQGNARLLESIKGIGRKSAERIVLELKDKLGKQMPAGSTISPLVNNSLELDALDALVSLGIARPLAEQAIKKVMTKEPETNKVEDIIKKALKTF